MIDPVLHTSRRSLLISSRLRPLPMTLATTSMARACMMMVAAGAMIMMALAMVGATAVVSGSVSVGGGSPLLVDQLHLSLLESSTSQWAELVDQLEDDDRDDLLAFLQTAVQTDADAETAAAAHFTQLQVSTLQVHAQRTEGGKRGGEGVNRIDAMPCDAMRWTMDTIGSAAAATRHPIGRRRRPLPLPVDSPRCAAGGRPLLSTARHCTVLAVGLTVDAGRPLLLLPTVRRCQAAPTKAAASKAPKAKAKTAKAKAKTAKAVRAKVAAFNNALKHPRKPAMRIRLDGPT